MRLLLCLCASLVLAGSAVASPLPEYPFVFTSGTADTDVPPDIAHLSFSVTVHHADAAAALLEVQQTARRVLTILEAAGVTSADIDASVVDKSPEEHWDPQSMRSVPDGYEASQRFVVTVRDLEKYPEMGRTLLDLANTTDFHPQFDRTDRAKIQGELFDRAAQNAKSKAERMAAAFGRKLGPVRAISQVSFDNIPNWLGVGGEDRYYAMADLKNAPDQLLVPGSIPIAEDVNVLYELQ